MGLTLAEKQALTAAISTRYQKAGKKEKGLILDELVKITGYNRKYALHLPANWGKTTRITIDGTTVKVKAVPQKRRKGGGRKQVYGDKTIAALRDI